MSEKLKPCPFCGGKNPLVEQTTRYFIVIECRKCGASMTSIKSIEYRIENGHEIIRDQAIKAWNRRLK